MRRLCRSKIAAILLATLFVCEVRGADLKAQSPATVQIPADFNAVDLSGKSWDVEALKGKMILIDFWATWCGPCLEQFPHLKDLYQRYHQKGLGILGINLDTAGRLDLEHNLRRHRIPWPQITDYRGFKDSLARSLGVTSLPTSLIFSPKENLTGINLSPESLEDLIQGFFSETK